MRPKKVGSRAVHTHMTYTSGLNVNANAFAPQDTQLVSPSEHVVMQTDFTVIQGQSDGRTLKARHLFDTGSSCTDVRETIQRSLELPVVREEVSAMVCFGSSQRQAQTLQQVKFSVQLRDGTFQQLLASVVPRISCPIWKMPLDVTKHPLLERATLAEPLSLTPEQVEIDILVGCDQYYDFILTERASFPYGLVLLDSNWASSALVVLTSRMLTAHLQT